MTCYTSCQPRTCAGGGAGGDLYETLKRAGGQLKEAQVAAQVLRPVMEALRYMHTLGVIHRDIKPENILLAADRTIKLADFGLSINHQDERPVTRAGTLDYMAPEARTPTLQTPYPITLASTPLFPSPLSYAAVHFLDGAGVAGGTQCKAPVPVPLLLNGNVLMDGTFVRITVMSFRTCIQQRVFH